VITTDDLAEALIVLDLKFSRGEGLTRPLGTVNFGTANICDGTVVLVAC
jgi:hypothetical protein